MNELIPILADFINEKKTIEGLNPDLSLARIHQVGAIIEYQCRRSGQEMAFQISNYANRSRITAEIDSLLNAVPHILVKGMAILKAYPQPALRSMGDIDYLIHISDVAKVEKILINADFDMIETTCDCLVFSKRGQTIEIHTQLIHDGPGKEKLVEYFCNAWDYLYEGQLDWNYQFLYLLAHLRGHFVAGGVGLRQFMDIALVEKNITIDWEWIIAESKKLQLYDFMITVLAFVQRWFNVNNSPFSLGLDEDFYNKSTDEIIKNGVFGKNNAENDGNMISRYIINTSCGAQKARNNYLCAVIFPPLCEMRVLTKYRYLEKYPILLPIAWMTRLVNKALNKNARSNLSKEMSTSKEKIRDRVSYLKQWGL